MKTVEDVAKELENQKLKVVPVSPKSSASVTSHDDDVEEIPEWRKNRREIDTTLEKELGQGPFQKFPLARGSKRKTLKNEAKSKSTFGLLGSFGQVKRSISNLLRLSSGESKTVGYVKGVFRVVDNENVAPSVDLNQFQAKKFCIRLYVLSCHGLGPEP